MSKPYYIKTLVLGTLGIWLLFALNEVLGLIVGIPVSIYLLFVYLSFHREMWSSIQDEYARTSPAKAAWFLLIPLFNLYWCFVVYPGFVRDYERYIKRHDLDGRKLPYRVFYGYAVISVAGFAVDAFGIIMSILLILSLILARGLSINIFTYLEGYEYLGDIGIVGIVSFFLIRYIIVIFDWILFIIVILRVCDAVNAITPAQTSQEPMTAQLNGKGG